MPISIHSTITAASRSSLSIPVSQSKCVDVLGKHETSSWWEAEGLKIFEIS